MKNSFKIILLIIGVFSISNINSQSLEQKLFELPDVIFKEIKSTSSFEHSYELKVKQPLDHFDLSKGYFYQKAYLSHKGFENPTVIVTEGYNQNRNRIYELTELLNANQIIVEHRFFGESKPDSLDYNYLRLKQATADLHHINQLFKKVYFGKWISTGISKGGATTIFYRYFYPNDVDVSVPYVAPINNSFEDKRIYQFLDTIGSEECFNKIRDFQYMIFENRDKILPLLKFFNLGARAKYTYLSLEEAFEYTVLEYPFSFWQYGHSCNEIPTQSSSIEEAVEYFLSVSDMTFFSDNMMDLYGPHYYQSATEMGYYGYEVQDFKNYLKVINNEKNPHATFLPNKMDFKFDKKLLDDVNEWIRKYGNKFIYIYGAIDTWTATGVPPNPNVDSKWFILEEKHHATARISEMTKKEKNELINTLENWLDIKID